MQYHNHLLGIKTLLEGECVSSILDYKCKREKDKFCAFNKKADVFITLRGIKMLHLSEDEIIIYDNFGHKKTTLRDAKLFQMLL